MIGWICHWVCHVSVIITRVSQAKVVECRRFDGTHVRNYGFDINATRNFRKLAVARIRNSLQMQVAQLWS